MSLQGAGGQPQKQGKYAALVTGRVFNGLVTNRSPLRGTLPSIYENYYHMSYGDVMIAGSNVEVSNRLTLIRRPGNSIFGTGTFSNVQLFNEFIVNKSTSDAFGTVLEEIFTLISEPGALWATGSTGVQQPVFSDSAVTSPYYTQAVGNELYFSNGVDNKKWFQSLINWAPNFQIQGSLGNTGTYAFLDTYLLTGDAFAITGPATADVSEQVVQQLVGVAVAYITDIVVQNGVLSIYISTNAAPRDAMGATWAVPPAIGVTAPVFQLWGLSTATWLNGVVFSTSNTSTITIGTTTVITANLTGNAIGNFVVPTADGSYGSSYGPIPDTGWVMQIGSTPVIPITGTTVPDWGTYADYVSNTNDLWGAPVSEGGNFVLDGNLLWVNRGSNVQNWGIAAPTVAITTSETNSTFSSWQPDTYYSISGFIQAPGGLWYQITQAGTTGATFGSGSAIFTELNPQPVAWVANTFYNDGEYAGSYPWTGSPVTINGVTYQQGEYVTAASTVAPSTPGYDPIYDNPQNSLVVMPTGGGPCLFQLQRNISQGNSVPTNVPISATYGGSLSGQIGSWVTAPGGGAQVESEGWSAAFFNTAYSAHGGNMFSLKFGGGVGEPVDFNTSTPVAPNFVAHSLSSTMWNYYPNGQTTSGGGPMDLETVTPAGIMVNGTFTNPYSGMPDDVFEFIQWGKIRIPVPGMTVTFTVTQSDAFFFGIDAAAGATYVSSTATNVGHQTPAPTAAPANVSLGGRTITPWNGYPILGGWNNSASVDTFTITVSFPNAGIFGMEFCYAKNSGGGSYIYRLLVLTANNSLIVPEGAAVQPWFESCPTSPAFGANGFTTTPAAQNTYPIAPENTGNANSGGAPTPNVQGLEIQWLNLGPVSAMQWAPGINVAVGNTSVIHSGDEFFAYEPGITGGIQPTTWNSGIYSLTPDGVPPADTLQWINEGAIPPITPATGSVLATSDQGWLYWIALVNTLDNTVSGLSPVSVGTGPVDGSVLIPPGSGLPNLALIDPQADYVAIFRSTDGFTTPFLIPGYGNSFYTVPLTTYLQDGYLDSTPDSGLNDLIQGAQAGENTPPLPGAGAFTYHLGRIFYSIGNTVYYTTGPLATVGNGNGTSPTNFDTLPSRVVRLVPTAIGLLIFTISDIYIIQGAGTPNSPLQPAVPYLQGVGLANYDALDIDGVLIGFFTTDKQFVILDPSAGLSYAGYPIGDQFRQNNGLPGTSWNTSTVSVAWYTFGEDQGWYVSDGQFGWYRLMATPAPEKGMCWSPFATIQGGIGAIASIQTLPGVHQLLMASDTGNILFRDLNSSVDEVSPSLPGVPYSAYAVFGSYVLAVPGQVAKIASITTDSVNVGTPLTIGVIIDEALPYFKGSFDIIKRWEFDPPCLKPSKSIFQQRFYLSDDDEEAAYCRHFQLLVQFAPENAASELIGFSVFGAYEVEA
jgi:hypothetical protein